MKDLNWEQGLVRVYYIVWFLLIVAFFVTAFVRGASFANERLVDAIYGVFVLFVIPAIVLKLLRWGIPWLIQGFVKKA